MDYKNNSNDNKNNHNNDNNSSKWHHMTEKTIFVKVSVLKTRETSVNSGFSLWLTFTFLHQEINGTKRHFKVLPMAN